MDQDQESIKSHFLAAALTPIPDYASSRICYRSSEMRLVAALAIASIVSGCADGSKNVAATYVSPLQYQSYNCRQLAEEAARVSARAAQVSGVQDKNASNDAVATGVALVIFWPALFFIGGNKETKAELARLKGEIEAIESASIQNKCSIQFRKTE